eukprot:g8641.t1
MTPYHKPKSVVRRHKIYVFNKSRICFFLTVLVLLLLYQLSIDDSADYPHPLHKQSHSRRYPLAKLRRKLFGGEAPTVQYSDSNLLDLNRSLVSLWTSSCPDECNSDRGWGLCDDNRCICNPGYGDTDCSFSIEVLYGNHLVYDGFIPDKYDPTGWDLGGDVYKILVQSIVPNLVIEVGVWKGASGLKLAQAVKEQGSGVFVAVDTWLPVLRFWENHYEHNRMQDLKFNHGYPDIFHTFIGNVIHQNLTEVVIPFPATAKVAFEFFTRRKTKAELIHLDISHSHDEVMSDLKQWWSVLRNGGVLMGDDWSWVWPGVLSAVRQFAKKHRLEINVYSNKWWIQKPLNYRPRAWLKN